MDKKHVLFKIKKISSVLSEPTIIVKINKIIARDNCTTEELAKVVETDPGLSTQVLRLANSSYYGLSRHVDTISRAVTVLGFNMVRDLTLTVSVFKVFAGGAKNTGLDAHGLWCHSLACAVAAKVLMGNIHSEEAQKAFMGGILHDVGKIIISNEFPKEQEQILAAVESGLFPSLLKAELSFLEMDHTSIGAEVAELWHFPRSLIEPIFHHHTPSKAKDSPGVVAAVHAGNEIAKALGLGKSTSKDAVEINSCVWEILGLTEAALPEINKEVQKNYELATELINL